MLASPHPTGVEVKACFKHNFFQSGIGRTDFIDYISRFSKQIEELDL
jgi:hypothetical protein